MPRPLTLHYPWTICCSGQHVSCLTHPAHEAAEKGRRGRFEHQLESHLHSDILHISRRIVSFPHWDLRAEWEYRPLNAVWPPLLFSSSRAGPGHPRISSAHDQRLSSGFLQSCPDSYQGWSLTLTLPSCQPRPHVSSCCGNEETISIGIPLVDVLLLCPFH